MLTKEEKNDSLSRALRYEFDRIQDSDRLIEIMNTMKDIDIDMFIEMENDLQIENII